MVTNLPKGQTLLATSFYGLEPFLKELADYSLRHVVVVGDFSTHPSAFGLPDTDSVPTWFHPHITVLDGWELMETNGLDLLVIGHDTPHEVARQALPGVVENGLVVFPKTYELASSRTAEAVLQSEDFYCAKIT